MRINRAKAAGVVLGVGLGGFVEGILPQLREEAKEERRSMERRKLASIACAAIFLAATFFVGCNRQEEAMRSGEGWATPSPTVSPTSSPGMAQQSYDLQFIDSMTAHHQQGIQMAQLAVEKARHKELREMAQKMVKDQRQEVEQMRTWREQWFAGQPQTVGGQERQMQQGQRGAQGQVTPGMTGSMQADLGRLQAATSNEFDVMFLEVMIQHHQSGVQMAQDALARAERQEVKQLAQEIVDKQQREITTMNQWLNTWRNERGRPAR